MYSSNYAVYERTYNAAAETAKPSQDELTKKAEVPSIIINNYEYNANTLSIEVLLKLAKVFSFSMSFPIGEGEPSSDVKEVLKRIEDIKKDGSDTKSSSFRSIT